MNDRALLKKIKTKVDVLSHLLGISDYTYIVRLVDPAGIKNSDPLIGSYAMVSVYEETREVELDINKRLLLKKPRELDKTLIHELLHVKLNEIAVFIGVLLKRYVKDSKARKTYRDQLENLEHKVVVTLSDLIAGRKKWRK